MFKPKITNPIPILYHYSIGYYSTGLSSQVLPTATAISLNGKIALKNLKIAFKKQSQQILRKTFCFE